MPTEPRVDVVAGTAGAELVRLARSVGLVQGEWVAIDGSQFQAVSSAKSVREREALEGYLEQLEQSDEQDEVVIDSSAVASALEKLRRQPEPEVGFMRTTHGIIPGNHVPTAVDAEHALIVAPQVTDHATDNRSLAPMAEAAQAAVGGPAQPLNGVGDAGYANGEQAEACQTIGILPHVPANRSVNNHGDGPRFERTEFTYQPESDTLLGPAGQTLARKPRMRKDRAVRYAARPEVRGAGPQKSRCPTGAHRSVSRHLHEEALQRMHQRATPEAMRLRRSTVEHPFANLQYRIFGHPRFLPRGLRGAQTEVSLAVTAYNLKRMLNILGGRKLQAALQASCSLSTMPSHRQDVNSSPHNKKRCSGTRNIALLYTFSTGFVTVCLCRPFSIASNFVVAAF